MRIKYKNLSKIFPSIHMRRFVVVGIANTLIDLVVFNVLLLLISFAQFGIGLIVAKLFGFIAASVFSYVMNGTWTFNQSSLTVKRYGVFLGVSIFGLMVNLVTSYVVFIVGIHAVPVSQLTIANGAFLCATFASFACNYVGYRRFVF